MSAASSSVRLPSELITETFPRFGRCSSRAPPAKRTSASVYMSASSCHWRAQSRASTRRAAMSASSCVAARVAGSGAATIASAARAKFGRFAMVAPCSLALCQQGPPRGLTPRAPLVWATASAPRHHQRAARSFCALNRSDRDGRLVQSGDRVHDIGEAAVVVRLRVVAAQEILDEHVASYAIDRDPRWERTRLELRHLCGAPAALLRLDASQGVKDCADVGFLVSARVDEQA